MADSGSGRQCYLIEWFQPDLAESAVDAAIDRLASAAVAVRAEFVVAVTAPVDETLFGVVAADRSDDVVTACRNAGWRVDRLTEGVRTRLGATAAASIP